MRWRLLKPVLVMDKAGGLWTPDGAIPFPITGYNFASVKKARIGWWIDPNERFVTRDRSSFVLLPRWGCV